MDLLQLAVRPAPLKTTKRPNPLPLSPYETHSLGRLVLADHPDIAGDLMVIDGQQRITTACLLLSALRDVLSPESRVREDINNLLYPNGGACCALTPTYFDRPSFEECVRVTKRKPASPQESNGSSSCDHVIACRRFFDAAIPRLLNRVRDKLGLQIRGDDT